MMKSDLDLRRKVYEALGWHIPDNAWTNEIISPIELSSGQALDALVEFKMAGKITDFSVVSECDYYRCYGSKHAVFAFAETGKTPAIAICKAIIAIKEKS